MTENNIIDPTYGHRIDLTHHSTKSPSSKVISDLQLVDIEFIGPEYKNMILYGVKGDAYTVHSLMFNHPYKNVSNNYILFKYNFNLHRPDKLHHSQKKRDKLRISQEHMDISTILKTLLKEPYKRTSIQALHVKIAIGIFNDIIKACIEKQGIIVLDDD